MNENVLVNTAGLKREQWLEYRRKGIGGSDAAGICGISKWKDPFSIWMDKMGRVKQTEPNEAMYWGNTLETIVRQEFIKRTGLPVRELKAHAAAPGSTVPAGECGRDCPHTGGGRNL